MRIARLDRKRKTIKAIVKSYSDLVFLQYIVEKGDLLTAYSRRKVTVGKSQEIKTVRLGIEVEKPELMESSLDVGGKIVYSSDEKVPLHKYHTISIKKGTGFVLRKKSLLNFHVSLLRQAAEASPKVFVCVYEEGIAIFYVMSNYRMKKKLDFKRDVSGKRFKNESRKDFFGKLSQMLQEEYRRGYDAFIVAGKALDNDDMRKNYLKGLNVTYETVSYADTGLKELLSGDRINGALSSARLSIQRKLMEGYLLGISGNDPRYVYGRDQIAAAAGRARPLQAILSKEYVLNNKEILEKLDAAGCEIVLFDENDESLNQLNAFGGIIVKFTEI